MGKNARLANIYIKIYNKQSLTMDDLEFLAEYDPECFEKTCRNIVYKVPKMKIVFEEPPAIENRGTFKNIQGGGKIENVLEGLKKLELDELPVQPINSEKVKELLGSLYMELMFPHNDEVQYFEIKKNQEESSFNKKV